MEKVEPSCGRDSTVRRPPWASIICLLIKSPSPVPVGFVVSRGVKIFGRYSGEIPPP